MAWADVTLTTPASIAKIEKEINTLTNLGTEKTLLSEEALAQTKATDAIDIHMLRGFAIIEIAVSEQSVDCDFTATLQHSDTNASFESTSLSIAITEDDLVPSQIVVPLDTLDYIRFNVVRTAGTCDIVITAKSVFADKHEVAKDIIRQMLYTYIGSGIDDLDNPEELQTPANFLVLHLIYADLVLGSGENEIYAHKMKHYWKMYNDMIKLALRRLTKDEEAISSNSLILR